MKIGVVGSINMDQVIVSSRIPNKGETLFGQSLHYNAGGKGANQAVAIARLGGNVVMFGKVGDDANGRQLIDIMKTDGVDTDYIRAIKGVDTGLAVITVGDNDNTILVIQGANALVDRAYIDEIKDELLTCDMVVLQNEIPEETNEYVISLCKAAGVKTLLNPAPARTVSEDVLAKVDFITPNEHEAKLIFGDTNMDNNLLKYEEKLIITRGEKGIAVGKDGDILEVPARKSKVVDTTGAGDTFNGAFVYAYMKGLDLAKALQFANIAAGLSTEKSGAQGGMPALAVVEKELN